MRLLVLASVLSVLPAVALAEPSISQEPCSRREPDRGWIASLGEAWNKVRPAAHPQPVLVTYDATCVWQVDREAVTGREHGGKITLPSGETMPPAVASFASTFGADQRPFIVMASPTVWRSQLPDEPNLDRLIRAVFVHEMTHVLQTPAFGPHIDLLSKRLPDPGALTDDIVQDTFGDDPEFRQAYEMERDLLYEAAGEPAPERRRRLIEAALSAMQSRRSRFFSGDRAVFVALEDLFLVMEGAGNWTAYQLLRSEGLDAAAATSAMRRGGRRWSQDLGLAIFLLLDQRGGDWRGRVFGGQAPPSIPELLRQGL